MSLTISTKQIWHVAYPIILGSLAQNVLIVTDTAFLGNLGEVALGGGVIGGLFYQVLLMLGWGISIGGQIIIARRFGEGERKQIGKIVEHLIYLLLLFAVVLMSLIGLFSDSILNLLVESDAVRTAGSEFFNYRLMGLAVAFIGYTFQSFYVGIARTKVITLSTVAMVVTNIILDYALMFGHFGLPNMGIAGAALASVIAECVGALTFIVYTFFIFDYKEYNLLKFCRFDFSVVVKLLKVGWPLMFEFSLSIFVWFFFFLFIEKMGEKPLAVSNIVRSLYNVILLPIWGFASATNSFVSQMIGKGHADEVIKLVLKIIKLSVLSVVSLSLLCLIFGRYAMLIYTSDAALIEQALRVMYVVEFAAIGMGGAYVCFNAVSGTGNTVVSFIIELCALIFHLAWAYIMAIKLEQSLEIVWLAELVYGTVTIALSMLYLKSKRWIGRRL